MSFTDLAKVVPSECVSPCLHCHQFLVTAEEAARAWYRQSANEPVGDTVSASQLAVRVDLSSSVIGGKQHVVDVERTQEKQMVLNLALYLHTLEKQGFAYLEDVPDGIDYLSELTALGKPVPQYGGELVRDVKPDPSIAQDIITPYNKSELLPHTEWYEFPEVPPRYLALWCIEPADRGGETTLADGFEMLAAFTPADIEELRRRTYRWRSQPTLQQTDGIDQATVAPILSRSGDADVLRFSSLFLECDDELSTRYVAEGKRYFAANHIAVGIARNGLLIWDNWRMLHARNGFRDDRRHLRRVLLS